MRRHDTLRRAVSMKRQVKLEYSLGTGWLAPWLDGLRNGRAVAATCSACEGTYFPPLRACPTCRGKSDGWRMLDGGATVLFRSKGLDGDVVMVRFDGANNACVAQAEALPNNATRCALTACADEPPTLALKAEHLS